VLSREVGEPQQMLVAASASCIATRRNRVEHADRKAACDDAQALFSGAGGLRGDLESLMAQNLQRYLSLVGAVSPVTSWP
jgi:hypothetical protein